MGSTRLPGKVLLPLRGRTVLGWVARAAAASGGLDDLVVATTAEPSDDAVAVEAGALGLPVVRGPVDDVLSRFLLVADRYRPDAIVRFTADCPLLDPDLVALVAGAWRAAPWLDYVSTALPRCVPRGMDVEVVRTEALRDAGRRVTGHHRTHVTSGVHTDPDRYRTLGVALRPDASDLRVTLDTADDWRLVTAVADHFGDRPAAIGTLVPWLRDNAQVTALNAHVRQKALEAG